MERKQSKAFYYVRITGVLLIITMCTALLLSFVNVITKDIIAENEQKETNKAISEIFPSATDIKTEALAAEGSQADEFYKVSDGDALVGYYAVVTPTGFKGEVKMIVGLNADGKVVGIKVLSHSETVGIGDKALSDSYFSGFLGKAENDTLPDAISGATYSSNAVREGIQTALDAFKLVKGGETK